jgi:hypothetical protein
LNNRFLLAKCIAMGAFSFPTPFFIYFFFVGVNAGEISYRSRFLLVSILLLGGALIGVASYYKDSAISALRDWYPSEK